MVLQYSVEWVHAHYSSEFLRIMGFVLYAPFTIEAAEMRRLAMRNEQGISAMDPDLFSTSQSPECGLKFFLPEKKERIVTLLLGEAGKKEGKSEWRSKSKHVGYVGHR